MADDNFLDMNHALLTGEILGALLKAGFDAEPLIDSDGDYKDTLRVKRPSGEWLVTISPGPGN